MIGASKKAPGNEKPVETSHAGALEMLDSLVNRTGPVVPQEAADALGNVRTACGGRMMGSVSVGRPA